MVFSSQTFLFFFLPLAGLCVLIRSKPVQNAMLLIASLIFYAWGEPKMVVLMVLVTLGGNRVSRGKWVRNILVVWGLTGLWHGADWNFLLWGLYYGVLLLIEKLWLGKYLERLPKALRWLLCMIIVCIGWVMFNLTDFAQMRCALARMFSFTHVALSQSLAADVSIVPPLLWMLPALVFSTPVCRRVHLGESCGAEIVRNVVCLALLAVCIVFSVSATFNPFIYFRF